MGAISDVYDINYYVSRGYILAPHNFSTFIND